MVVRFAAPAGNLPADLLAQVDTFAQLRAQLTRGIDEDARSYDAVRAARTARKASPSDPKAQAAYLDALRGAALVPLETAEAIAKAESLLASVKPRIKPIFGSDVRTAEELLRAGKAGAVANAEINLASLRESQVTSDELVQRLRALGSGP